MLSASRQLIRDRRSFSKRAVEHVVVSREGDGRHDEGDFTPNTSYQLAMDEFMANAKHITLIGWLVLPYDKATKTTYILHHWWNLNTENDRHFDRTFKQGIGEDYIVDHDLTYRFMERLKNMLDKPLCSSLILSDGKYRAMDLSNTGEVIYRPLANISFEQLCPELSKMDIRPKRAPLIRL